MEIKNYNPSDVTITVASRAFGTFAITGLGEDNIECSADNDFAEAVTGFQGDVVINESAKRNGTIKVSVQATSPQWPMLRIYFLFGLLIKLPMRRQEVPRLL